MAQKINSVSQKNTMNRIPSNIPIPYCLPTSPSINHPRQLSSTPPVSQNTPIKDEKT